jgi:hypothetical protein
MSDALITKSILDVYRLEKQILKQPQIDLPVENAFCHGLYARTMFIPADTVLTGAAHKEEGFFVVRSGILIVTTDNGPVQVSAGYMGITSKGAKRAGYAVTDVVFTTFHANPEEIREEKDIWDKFTEPPPANIEKLLEGTE